MSQVSFMLILLYILSLAQANEILEKCKLQSFSIMDKEGIFIFHQHQNYTKLLYIDKIARHFEQLLKEQQQIPFECLEFLIQRGFYKTAVDIYENYFILNQIDVSQDLENLRNRDRSLENTRELQYIFKNSFSQTKRVQTVQPIMVWAQSKNHTLINIKFSHRIDSPACLNAKIEELRIENDTIILRAFGIVGHIPIRYESRIKLFQSVVPELSTFKHEAVGTLFFNLTKSEPNSIFIELWIRLTNNDVKTAIWWDLHDQLRNDMDEFIKLLEEESERKEKNSDKKSQKAQKKREQEKKRQDRLAAIERQRQWEFERNQCNIIPKKCENGWYQRQ